MSIINPVLGPPTDVSNCNSHIWVPAAFCQLTNMVILEFCNVAPVSDQGVSNVLLFDCNQVK